MISGKGGASRGGCKEIEPASGRRVLEGGARQFELESGGTLAWPPGGSARLARLRGYSSSLAFLQLFAFSGRQVSSIILMCPTALKLRFPQDM